MFNRYSVFAYKEDNVKIEICFFFMYLDIQMKYSSLIPENEPSSDDFFSYKRIWVPKVPRSADPQFSNTCLFLLIIIRDDDLMMSHALTRSSIANGFQSEIKITSNGNIHGLLSISTQHFKKLYSTETAIRC